ncbi:Fnr-like transcriptional activator [Salinisphaera shabanensis T35B1]|jgi:CRP-like cAMP-binding protein|uniref:Regulatory protein n=1 Tax=Salinisphaera shabanensis E1L3A TaxID=1033802 RepID=U2ESF5_9GAMM|nr:Crp/Fnr family transcriptional regulator [Salinisphaera shabanensis]ERJ20912.1 Putative regulatory protein [Salinisphaera shabanensis E1L3A]
MAANDGDGAREIREALKHQYFLEGMSDVQRARLVRSAATQSFAAGQTLFHRGDPADTFFVVLAGRVKLYRLSIDGDEKIMGLVGTGESFGEGVLFMHPPRYPVSAQALEKSRVVAISRGDYLDEIQHSFQTCMSVMYKLTARIERLLDEVESLTLRDSRYRVVNYLLELIPERASGPVRLRLPTSKSAIAGRLAIRAETFSRTLRQLAENGTIVLCGGRTIEVPNPKRLRHALSAKSGTSS